MELLRNVNSDENGPKKTKRREADYGSYIKKLSQRRKMKSGKKASITDEALEIVNGYLVHFTKELGKETAKLSAAKGTKVVSDAQIQNAGGLYLGKADSARAEGQLPFKERCRRWTNERKHQYRQALEAGAR